MLTHMMVSELASRDTSDTENLDLQRFPCHMQTNMVQACTSHTRLSFLCKLFDVTSASQAELSFSLTSRLWYEAYVQGMPDEVRWTCKKDAVTCAVIWGKIVVMGTSAGTLLVWSPYHARVGIESVGTRGRAIVALWIRPATEDTSSYLYALNADSDMEILSINPRTLFRGACSSWVNLTPPKMRMATRTTNWAISTVPKSDSPVIMMHDGMVYTVWEVSGDLQFRRAPIPEWRPIHRNMGGGRTLHWTGASRLDAFRMGNRYLVKHLCGCDGWVAWWSTPRRPTAEWDGASVLMITHITLAEHVVPNVVNLTETIHTVTCLAMLRPDTLLVGFSNGGILQYTLSMHPTERKVIATLVRNLDTGLGDVISIHCHPDGSRYAVASSTDMLRIYDRVGVIRTVDLQCHRGSDRRKRENRNMKTLGRIVCMDDERLFCYEVERLVCHVWTFGPVPEILQAEVEAPPKRRRRSKKKRKKGQINKV